MWSDPGGVGCLAFNSHPGKSLPLWLDHSDNFGDVDLRFAVDPIGRKNGDEEKLPRYTEEPIRSTV